MSFLKKANRQSRRAEVDTLLSGACILEGWQVPGGFQPCLSYDMDAIATIREKLFARGLSEDQAARFLGEALRLQREKATRIANQVIAETDRRVIR